VRIIGVCLALKESWNDILDVEHDMGIVMDISDRICVMHTAQRLPRELPEISAIQQRS